MRTVANRFMYVRGVLKHAESVCSRQRLDISHGAGESRAACCDPCGDRLSPVDPDIRADGGGRYGHVDIRRTTLAFRVLALASTLPPARRWNFVKIIGVVLIEILYT